MADGARLAGLPPAGAAPDHPSLSRQPPLLPRSPPSPPRRCRCRSLQALPVHIPAPDSPADAVARTDKLTVVVDLDETLVCAYETSSLPALIRNQATDAGLTWFELECVSGDKDDEGNLKVNHVTVFERPGLHTFLKEISEFADLILFTAGLEGYASPLVDKIDLERRFILRLYRPSTVSTKYRQHVKRSFLLIEGYVQNRDCGQQSIQFFAPTG